MKMAWLPQRLGVQLVLLFSLLLCAAMLAFIGYGISQQTQYRESSMKLQAEVLARNLAATSADYLLSRDYTSIEFSLLRAAQFPGIIGIQVCDSNGNILGDVLQQENGEAIPRYTHQPLKPPGVVEQSATIENNRLTVWQPIVLGELLGWVQVQYSLAAIFEEVKNVWGKNSIVGLIILLIAGSVLLVIQRKPVAGIRSYTEFADHLVECKGKLTPIIGNCLELRTLGVALNLASSRLYEQSTAINNAMADLERMAAFAEHAPYLILSVDNEGAIEYVNPYCDRILTRLNIDGENIKQLLPANLVHIIHKTVRSQIPATGLEVNYGDRSLSWTIAPVRGQQIVHMYGVDETERKHAEEKARSALVEKLSAVAANKAKSQFLANMSHELRTPLNAIIGYSEMLEEEAADAGYTELSPDLIMIRNAGRHLLALINEILDLSKIEAGRMELTTDAFQLNELVKDVIATVQPLVVKNNNKLELFVGNNLGEVRTDQIKVRQILYNLISNASKFTENGKIELYVSRDQIHNQDWLTFEVKDSGIGMSREQLERIFEPFSQADSSTTRRYGGTGLGLAITKRFCSMLGGEINVISEPGRGTTFTAKLRANITTAQAQEHNPFNLSAALPSRLTAARSAEIERRKQISTVLVVDDDPIIRKIIKHYLMREGFMVRTASNGHAGLALARQLKPALITMDVMMPGMDGLTVLRQLKADETLKHIPVAIVTVLDEQNIAKSLGADDFLEKPIDWDALIKTVKKWVRQISQQSVLVVSDNSILRNLVSSCNPGENLDITCVPSAKATTKLIESIYPSMIMLDLDLSQEAGNLLLSNLESHEDFKEIKLIAFNSNHSVSSAPAWLSSTIEIVNLQSGDNQDQLMDDLRKLLGNTYTNHAAA